MGSFAADITAWVRKTGVSGEKVLHAVSTEALENLVDGSPVWTGRFRGSWRVGVNESDLSMLPPFPKRVGLDYAALPPDGALADGTNRILTAKFGDSVYITNNVPYATLLERGYSPKAPAGVLEITLAKLKSNFDGIVASTKQ